MTLRLGVVAARGSGMALQFACGVLLTLWAPSEDAAAFFAATSAVALLVSVLGLELHTYTDRLVANGMGPGRALAELGRMQAPWVVAVVGVLLLFGSRFGWTSGLTVSICVNAVVGLVVQECFRMLVVRSRQFQANLLLVLRNTLPFGVACLGLFGGATRVDLILWGWALGGVLAATAGLIALLRNQGGDAMGTMLSRAQAFRTAAHYAPVAVVARSLIGLDVVVVASIAAPEVAAVYGNAAAVAAAFFTLADLVVVQWRMGAILRAPHALEGRVVLGRESTTLGLVSGVAVGLVGGVLLIEAGYGADGWAWLTVACLGFASFAAIEVQARQLSWYARRQDRGLLRAYLTAGALFGAVMVASALTATTWLVAVARACGWGAVWMGLRWGKASAREVVDAA